jgi:phospholipid/cholesterol/gamma-HCH transport system substrate-binding protein
MFGKTNHLISVFNNVNGLQLGNNVRYSGVNVGTVRSIEMINDTIIKVDMIIEKKIFNYIRKNAVAIIGSDGLVGNRIINILPSNENSLPVMDGDEIKSIRRISTDDMLNTLETTNKNAALLTADILKITQQINNGKGPVGVLIKDSIVAVEIKAFITNLKNTSTKTHLVINKVNQILNELNQKNNLIGVIKDTLTSHKIKKILINVEQSSSQINTITQNLDKTILNIKEGEGAINYLSNNPKLVQKIDSTMININNASLLINEDLKALQHNFLFRGYFKQLEKERVKTIKLKQNSSTSETDKKY